MTEWKYGDAGDRWPVKPGDIWQVGPHILACGDLERGAGLELVRAYGPVALAYVDPPYNPGLAKGFRTKAGLPAGQSFDYLLQQLLAALKLVRGDIYLEIGNNCLVTLIDAIKAQDGTVGNIWSITYYGKREATLVRCHFNPDYLSPDAGPDLTGHDDASTPQEAMEHGSRAGDTVVDLCLGLGLSLKVGHMMQRRVVGMELHPRRLAVGIDWLAHLGLKPERIGTLDTMKEADDGTAAG